MVSEFEFCETSTLNISPINSYVSILLPIKNLWEHNRWNHWFLHDEQWPKYEEVCFVVHYSSNASIGMWNQLLRLNREFCVLHESKVSVVADEEEQVKGAPPRVCWMFWIDSTEPLLFSDPSPSDCWSAVNDHQSIAKRPESRKAGVADGVESCIKQDSHWCAISEVLDVFAIEEGKLSLCIQLDLCSVYVKFEQSSLIAFQQKASRKHVPFCSARNWEQMNDTHVSRQRSWLFLKTVGSEKILVRSINFKFIKS